MTLPAICPYIGLLSIFCSAVVYSVLLRNEEIINLELKLKHVSIATLVFSMALLSLVVSTIIYGLGSTAYTYSFLFLIFVEIVELCGLIYTQRNVISFTLDKNFTDFVVYIAVIYLLVDKAVGKISMLEFFMLFSYLFLMSTALAVMSITVLSVYIMWRSRVLSTLIERVNLVKSIKIVCFAYATLGMICLFEDFGGIALLITLASVILLLATAQTIVELYDNYILPIRKIRGEL